MFQLLEDRLVEYEQLSSIDVESARTNAAKHDIVLYDLENENADLQRDLKLVSMGIDEIVSAPSLRSRPPLPANTARTVINQKPVFKPRTPPEAEVRYLDEQIRI